MFDDLELADLDEVYLYMYGYYDLEDWLLWAD